MASTHLNSFVAGLLVEDVVADTWRRDRILSITENESVAEAMKKMASAKIHSLPVLQKDHNPLGFVTIHDLVHYVVVKAPDVLEPETSGQNGRCWEDIILRGTPTCLFLSSCCKALQPSLLLFESSPFNAHTSSPISVRTHLFSSAFSIFLSFLTSLPLSMLPRFFFPFFSTLPAHFSLLPR